VLEEIVGSAVEATKRELSNHQLQIAIPEEFPLLYVDGVLMEQVLVNLLDNAARYTPPQSEIEISAQAFDRRAELRVADNGPGLPAGSESKVFDKFFRAASAAPDSRRGVGLGLAICWAIVEAHGGKITAITRSQGGAEFIIVLPFNEAPPKITIEPDSVPVTA
jgi:two-component system sensor histidine kinase KdpD